MPDFQDIIEIIIKAKDDTSRAFASATANIAGFDEAQKRLGDNTKAGIAAQRAWAEQIDKGKTPADRQKDSITRLNASYNDLKLSANSSQKAIEEHVRAIQNVEIAQARVTKLQREGASGTSTYAAATIQLKTRTDELSKVLKEQGARTEETARQTAISIQRQAEMNTRAKETLQINAEIEAQQKRLLALAQRPAKTLASPDANQTQEIEATRALLDIRRRLTDVIGDQTEAENRLSEVRRQALRDQGFADEEDARKAKVEYAYAEALREVAKARREVNLANRATKRGDYTSVSEETAILADTNIRGLTTGTAAGDIGGNLGYFSKIIGGGQGGIGGLSQAGIGLIAPWITAIGGLAGAFGSVTSAVTAASTAVSAGFMTAMAQAIPAMGIFGASLQRLTSIFGYVQQIVAQTQARFVAQYMTAYQTALGINQVNIAEHNYSDTLFQAQQAVNNVRVAQLGLLTARQQAYRQLQQLVFQEEQARLAALASSLALTDAQKALQQAVATGGDVQQAQLQVAQAQVGHQQAIVQMHNAITDAASGSLARQNIAQTVRQAEIGLVSARRAVVDSQYALAQARAAIIEARQAAVGYDVGVQAQLAFLRSQMTQTERVLSGYILTLYRMFQGAHGVLRPITDQIIGAFVPIVGNIIRVLRDPRILGALQQLAHSMAGGIGQITKAFFSPAAINTFIYLIHQASANVKPLARIIVDFLTSVGAIVRIVSPFLHQILIFIEGIANQFTSWVSSTQGKNQLKAYFSDAFDALKSLISLFVAFGKLFFSILGEGGGARSGIGLIDDFTKKINRLTKSINDHGSAWHVLQRLWASARPILADLGMIFGALAKAILDITGSAGGQQGLHAMAVLLSQEVIPAITQFLIITGQVISDITRFLAAHQNLATAVTALATAYLGFRFVRGIIGGLLGGTGRLLSDLGKLQRFFTHPWQTIKDVWGGKPFEISGQPILDACTTGAERLGAAIREALGVGSTEAATKIEEAEVAGGAKAAEEEKIGEVQGGAIAGEEEGAGAAGGGGINAVEGFAGGSFLSRLGGGLGWLSRLGGAAASLYALYQATQGVPTSPNSQFKFVPSNKYIAPNQVGTFGGSVENSLSSIPIIGKAIFGLTGSVDPTTVALQRLNKEIKNLPPLTDLSKQQLESFRQEVLRISRMPDMTERERQALRAYAGMLTQTQVAMQRWAGTFKTFSATGIQSAAEFRNSLISDGQQIASRWTRGTQQWTTQVQAVISVAMANIQQMTADGVKGVGQDLQSLWNFMVKYLPGFQTQLNQMGQSLMAQLGMSGTFHASQLSQSAPSWLRHSSRPHHTSTPSAPKLSVPNPVSMPSLASAPPPSPNIGGGNYGPGINANSGGSGAVPAPSYQPAGRSQIGPGGTFSLASISFDTPAFYRAQLQLYLRAQQIANSINTFTKNFELLSGPNGLFALAAQAISDLTTRMTNTATLAANGIRMIGSRFVSTTPLTQVASDIAQINVTNVNLRDNERLVSQESRALREINRRIRDFGRVTASNMKYYQQLVGARQQILQDIMQLDQQIGSDAQQALQLAQQLFQDRLTKAMRASTNALAYFQQLLATYQAIGTTGAIGRTGNINEIISSTENNLRMADQGVIAASQAQVQALQHAYDIAAQKARRDPRWQSVADQIYAQLQQAISSVSQAQAQALQDAMNAQQEQAQYQNNQVQVMQTVAQVQQGFGNFLGGALTNIQAARLNQQYMQQQYTATQGLLTQAEAQGNTQAILTLTEQLQTLGAQIQQANLTYQQAITAYGQAIVTMYDTAAQTQSGIVQTAQGIFQLIGQIQGNQALPQQIQVAQENATQLAQLASSLVQKIVQDMSNGTFGSYQGQVNAVLGPLMAAFQQSPQAFAALSVAMGSQISNLMGILPQDMQGVFNDLISAMGANTTATVQNTANLQQLEATTNQQNFSSSAWTMFRDAIFNGLGGLLPQYAMSVPSMDIGGNIQRSGLIFGHAGEQIVPANISRTNNFGTKNIENHFHIDHPMEVADPVHLSNAVAWKMNHDPDSR
jgi:hypothetical protein